MAEEGVTDFHSAKRKAAERLGITGNRAMPRNIEIEQALQEYQAIFRQHQQPSRLEELRLVALEVMRILKPFSPRLVGAVLRGTADIHSPINLHLFCDNSEEIGWALMEHHLPFTIRERQYRYSGESEPRCHQVYSIRHDDIEIELTVFSENGIRLAPKSPLDGKPIQRASCSDVEKLLQRSS